MFEISAGGGCPSWQVISFVKCSASLLSELCPWGSPYGVTRAQGGALTSSLCVPGTWVLLKAGVTASTTAFRVCGRALSLSVFRHGSVCLAGDFPTKDSKTTTPVQFLEIIYFEVRLNEKDKILPNP